MKIEITEKMVWLATLLVSWKSATAPERTADRVADAFKERFQEKSEEVKP